jgi:tRNA threonylcarbamoyladenosine biosynthesis protein TsaB
VWVARLGAAADPDPASVKPLYLRAPDAHPQTAGVLPRQ